METILEQVWYFSSLSLFVLIITFRSDYPVLLLPKKEMSAGPVSLRAPTGAVSDALMTSWGFSIFLVSRNPNARWILGISSAGTGYPWSRRNCATAARNIIGYLSANTQSHLGRFFFWYSEHTGQSPKRAGNNRAVDKKIEQKRYIWSLYKKVRFQCELFL